MILSSVIVYAVCVSALAAYEHRWLPGTRLDGLSHWWLQHAGLPGARVLCVMLFIASAFPALYGIEIEFGFGQLIGADHRFSDWFNLLFLAGLTLPLLPRSQRLVEFILPLQGGLGVAMVFRWLTIDLDGAALPVLPNASTLTFAIAWAAVNLAIAGVLRRTHRHGRGDWIIESLLLWMQLPILLVYGRQLGSQLT